VSKKKQRKPLQATKADHAALAEANREMFGDDVEELISLGILPDDLGDKRGDVMPTLPMEFEVYCATCGAGLCSNCTEGRTTNRGMPFISVDPCEKCLDAARDEGYSQGEQAALQRQHEEETEEEA
jgi:flavoprotein